MASSAMTLSDRGLVANFIIWQLLPYKRMSAQLLQGTYMRVNRINPHMSIGLASPLHKTERAAQLVGLF